MPCLSSARLRVDLTHCPSVLSHAVLIAALSALCSTAVLPAQTSLLRAPAVPQVDASYRRTIGRADGDAHDRLAGVAGAVRLSNGEIVVANRGTHELRWYDANGSWLRSVGREGAGPGEYRHVSSVLRLRGDSLLVSDAILARHTLYDRAGRLVRSWPMANAGSSAFAEPFAQLSDGSFLSVLSQPTSKPPGHLQYASAVVRSIADAVRDTLVSFAGGESFNMACGRGGSCNVGVPYGVTAMAAALGDRIFVANGERYELLETGPAHGVTRTIRRAVPPVPLTPARLAFYRDSAEESVKPAARAAYRASIARAPVRRTMPYFSALIADDGGRLWLGRPQGAGDAQRAWDVLTPDGALLGTVTLPAALRVMHIAGGHIVGVTKDDDGVEYIEVRRLIGR
jgi:hypothetical protein